MTLGSSIATLATASTKSLPRIPVWDGIHKKTISILSGKEIGGEVDTLNERLGGVQVCEGVQGR